MSIVITCVIVEVSKMQESRYLHRFCTDPSGLSGVPHSLQDDFDHTTDRYLLKIKSYAKALPYSIESNSKMQDMLDFICMRIVQCVEAKDYDPGFLQWDSMLT